MQEMVIDSIRFSVQNYGQRVVILRQKDSTPGIYLPILSIIVSDLKNDTFFAKILLEYKDNTIELDSRPSDAIALAVRSKAKIFAENLVVEKAGVTINQETNTSDPSENQNLSIFKEFVDTLDIDDLGNSPK